MRPRPWRSGIGSRLRALADVLDPVAAVDDEPGEPQPNADGGSNSAAGFAGVDLSDAPEHWLRLVRNAGLVADEPTRQDVDSAGTTETPQTVSPVVSPGDPSAVPKRGAQHAAADAAPTASVSSLSPSRAPDRRNTSEVTGPAMRELSPSGEQPRLNLTRSIYAREQGRADSVPASTRTAPRPANVRSPAHRAPNGTTVSAGPGSPSTGTDAEVPVTPRSPVAASPIGPLREDRATAPPVEQPPHPVELRTRRPNEPPARTIPPRGSSPERSAPISFSTPQVRRTLVAVREVGPAVLPSFVSVIPDPPVPPVWPELRAPSGVFNEPARPEVQVVLLERVDRLRREQRAT